MLNEYGKLIASAAFEQTHWTAIHREPTIVAPHDLLMTMNIGFFCLCILLALPTLARCQVVQMPSAADFQEGEQWTWRRVDELTKLETAVVGRQTVQKDGALAFLGTSKRYYTLDQIYKGRMGWREWPLEVGKAWKYKFQWSSPTGEPGATSQDVKVVAYEKISVPAGTYMALRIEYKGSWNMTDFAGRHWAGEVNDTWWYAPEVKADVKHTFVTYGRHGSEQWISELMSYRPAAK